MANEISTNCSLTVAKNGTTLTASNAKSITMSGDTMLSSVQIIGTSTEAISMGDVSAPGYVYFKNQDATNLVRIGLVTAVTSGNAMVTLLPGEFATFPTRQTVIYAIADTAPCNLEVLVTSL